VFDIEKRVLNVELSDGEIAKRVQAWQRLAPRYTTGVMAKYARLVTSAATGAVT
jgi:dihydroxy-acid dehydratase